LHNNYVAAWKPLPGNEKKVEKKRFLWLPFERITCRIYV